MDFDLTNEQRLLRESVDRLLVDTYSFEQRRAYAAGPSGWSAEQWSRYASLGLLGLPFAEAEGGFGGGPVETMIVMEAFGRALVIEPYLPGVVLCGALLRHAATPAERASLLPPLLGGTSRLAFAQAEPTSRWSLEDVATTARRDGGSWVLNGRKSLVLHGDSADRLLVTARVGGGRRDRSGIGLFLVASDAEGVEREGYPTQDMGRAAEITLKDARGTALGSPEDALPAVERAVDETIAALCAEAVGAMTAAQALTVDYLRTRRQFGRAIGDFQALQHRAVDMLVQLEQSRSIALYATMMASEADAAERRRAVSAAKWMIGRNGRRLAEAAVQLHGGIGVALEYSVGHYLKRLTAIDLSFGDSDTHLAEVARLGGLIATEREPA